MMNVTDTIQYYSHTHRHTGPHVPPNIMMYFTDTVQYYSRTRDVTRDSDPGSAQLATKHSERKPRCRNIWKLIQKTERGNINVIYVMPGSSLLSTGMSLLLCPPPKKK